MHRTKYILVILLILCLLFVNGVLAGSSTNYRVDWIQPMTGSAGRSASANYVASITVGQTAVGNASSTHYWQGLGYWYGYCQTVWRLLLPMLGKP